MNLYKCCLRFMFNEQFHDLPLIYTYAENSKEATLKFQEMLKTDNELATFFDEDFVGVEDTIDSWSIFIIRPDRDWSTQESILSSLDYKTFEILKGDEDTASYFYGGIYPDNY